MSTGRTAGLAILAAALTATVSEAVRLFVEPLRFGPLGTAIVAVVTAVIVEAIGMLKDIRTPRQPEPQHPTQRYPTQRYPGRRPPHGPPYRPAPVRRGGGTVVVMLVVLAVIGTGVYGGSWLFRYVTGTQTGVERMASPPAQGEAGALTLVVRGVEVTPDFMKFRLRATNDSDSPITVAVNEQWCKLIDGNGTSLSPYGGFTGLGSGDIEVPANGVPVEEVLTFKGEPSSLTFTLSFSALFTFGPGPHSIQITGIRLTGTG